VIEAIPVSKWDFRPDEKSKTALELAWHLAQSECFFLNAAASGKFEPPGPKPDNIQTSADVLKWYDENAVKVTAALSGVKGDALTTPLNLAGVFNFPAIGYLGLANNQAIHHRGQLATYPRPMGAKVPRIYGPCTDGPMQVPAAKA
jgi:uncharacterized damage-inducible protein DinB